MSLEIKHVRKQLGGKTVVEDINFRVADGEFVVLLGPSGGGKTTLLRLVCGLEQVDAGEVVIAGRDVTHLPPRERNLGMVFQDYGLYPNMNVFDNVAYGLEARRLPRAEVDRRVREAAEKVGLTPHLASPIGQLSGGEQQRVALARALSKDADAYLYDEPLSNLDPKLRFGARRDIQAAHRLKGKPSLYVTHDQDEAFALADRVALIGEGRLQQIGTPDELLRAPANLFVARFIGSPPMNLLRGHVQGNDFVHGDVHLRLPGPLLSVAKLRSGGEVILGLRPDALARSDQPCEFEIGEHNRLRGEVLDMEALVGETVATLGVGSARLQAVFQDSLFEDTGLSVGQALEVGVDLERVRLFDPGSGRALEAV